jgi:hypothetical protein
MKYLFVILLLISNIASAKEVTVTGYGSTYDAALANAKMQALESVTGTFITGEQEYKNGKYSDSAKQYNGGIIKSFRVTEYKQVNSGVEVTIIADVVEKKDNRVTGKNEQEFNIEFGEHEQRRGVVDKLDNVNSMIVFTVSRPAYEIDRNSSIVTLNIGMQLQPKWVSDLQAFTSVIDEKGKTRSNTYANIHGGVVSSLITINPLIAAAFGSATAPSQPEYSEQNMVCFASGRGSFMDCKNIGVTFVNIPKYPKLIVEVVVNGVSYVAYESEIEMQLYEYIYPGDYKQHKIFKSYRETVHQPTWMIYTGERQSKRVQFRLENHIAKNVEKVRVSIR